MSKNKDGMSEERWAYIKQLAPSRGSYLKGSRGRTYKAGRNAAKRKAKELDR